MSLNTNNERGLCASRQSLKSAVKLAAVSILTGALLSGCASFSNSMRESSVPGDDGEGGTFVSELPSRNVSEIARRSVKDTFKVGDIADVSVYQVESLNGTYSVDREGFIDFPLIGDVQVAGVSTRQLQKELEARYGNGLVRNPNVTVKIEQLKLGKLVVDGAVNDPGVFEVFEIISIAEAIAMAGGITIDADKDDVYLVRGVDGEQKILRVDLNAIRKQGQVGPDVYPDDIIYVQSSSFRLAYTEFLRTIPLLSALLIASAR